MLVSICFLVSIFSPWVYINFDVTSIFGINRPQEISGLKVVTLSGDLEVYIDNQKLGTLKEETRSITFDTIQPGFRLITIKRPEPKDKLYWTFNRIINFEKNTTAVVALNLGPTKEFSEGHIIYAVKKEKLDTPTQLNVIFESVGGVVQINNEVPIVMQNNKTYSTFISLDQQNKIYVEKSGYEPQEFVILPETQEERNKFKNYDINIELFLFLQPLEVNKT